MSAYFSFLFAFFFFFAFFPLSQLLSVLLNCSSALVSKRSLVCPTALGFRHVYGPLRLYIPLCPRRLFLRDWVSLCPLSTHEPSQELFSLPLENERERGGGGGGGGRDRQTDRQNWPGKMHEGYTGVRVRCPMCGLFVGCLTSKQHAGVSQGRICSDNFTCCHTKIEAADQTFYLTQSQYTDQSWPYIARCLAG